MALAVGVVILEEIKEFALCLDFSEENAKEILEIIKREKENGNYRLEGSTLNTIQDYICEYETWWFRYDSWEELLQSEEEQPKNYGLNEEELKALLNQAIFQLNSGMYIQNIY